MIMANPTDPHLKYHNILLGLLVLLSTFVEVRSLCDSTEGCYPDVFNILENLSQYPARSIYASSTCGGNSSTPVEYQSLLNSDTNTYTCTPASIQPINVADEPISPTYWQSDKMIDTEGAVPNPQFMVFNFTDEFLFHEMFIVFAVPHLQDEDNSADARPAAFSVEKMDASGPEWVALHHFARDCATSFPGIPRFDPFDANRSPTTVFCEEYPPVNDGPFIDDDNYAEYNPGFNFYTHGEYFKEDVATISRYTVSALRLTFLVPASNRPLKSYVAIRDVTLVVQCKCFGHADSCGGPNEATCNCQHNTTGHQCHQCLPLYNKRQWTLGTKADAGACLECTCTGHATSCTFDQVKGYGVCDNCTDNTTGDECNTCVSGHYVNPSRVNVTSATSSDSVTSSDGADAAYCLACNCNQDGTQPASLSTCDVTTGQCTCKERVTERDCSSCKDTYWGLSVDKVLGCDECSCNADGSIGSANMCNKTTGACLCKSNVEGTTCNTCKPYTYGFSASKPDGCTACDCDPGASLDKTCDLTSGQCSCRSNLGGRDCRFPASGQYVPRLDAIIVEPETSATENVVLRSGHGNKDATVSGRGFVTLTSANQIELTFTASLSGQMDVIVRFEKMTQDSLIILQGTLRLTSEGSYSCNGATTQTGQQWALNFNGVKDGTRGGVQMGEACLNAGSDYMVQITNQGSALLIDSIVFMPETVTLLTTLVDRMNVDNITKCTEDAVNKIRATRDDCAAIEFSLMAAFFNGPVACSCTGGAFASTGCNSRTGDCYCLPGVLTPDCSQCMVDHYQFSTTTGCRACSCLESGSIVDYCDAQGVCDCLPNVEGTKCDSCAPEHYGLYTGNGCSPCQCNPTYSINNNCNDTGDCSCQPGVQGPLCNACMGGYFNLSSAGCTQCACHPDGSTDRSCDVTTGKCECLPSVEGSTCSSCKPGTFGLGSWHSDGCIPCFCWGHGTNCSSASGWFDAPVSSEWPLSSPDSLLTDKWVAEDSDGTLVSVQTPTVDSSTGQKYAMRVDPAQLSTRDIYFVAPAKFLGNRQSSYGRYLTVVVKPSPSVSSSSSLNTDTATERDNYGDVILQGAYSDATFIYMYKEADPNRTSDSEITAKIPLREGSWQAVYTTETNNVTTRTVNNATYDQFMEMLVSLTSMKIKAYLANTPHSAMDLLSVRLETAVDGAKNTEHSDVAVNNVEMCACESGYMGNSCQQCGKDYTRAIPNTTHPSSPCVPCSCNGHGVTQCDNIALDCSRDSVTSCDPLTGICTCQHNTQGDHCEFCLPGYYGDPLKGTADDCLPCACPGIIVANETNVFANNCSQNAAGEPVCNNCKEGHTGNHCELCIDGYFGTPENATNFGGACRPCVCNGRADTCDTRTGECIACMNNTAGQTCDICAPGYFGDAMNENCQPCNCTFPGSTGQCDHVTGTCECLPFVSGASCDVCDDETFNLTASVGCQPCDCFMNGSTSTICEKDTGKCTCRRLVEGRRCDMCQESFWNVNIVTGCNPCECNPEGTAQENGTTVTSCDVITGQCTCALPGIVGRTCDACSPVSKYTFDHINLFYIGVYPQCVLCGECFDSWALRIDEIGQEFTEMNGQLVKIWNNYDNQTAVKISTELDVIEEKVIRTTASLSNFEVVAAQLQQLYLQISQALTKHSAISSEVDMLTQSELALSTTLSSLAILTDMVQVTNTTMASLSTLRQQYDELIRETEASARQGNASWIQIQSLAFVVASPEDRERQLRQQAERLMQIATLANQTLTLTKNLHETSLIPGTTENARGLESASGTIANVTVTLTEVKSILEQVKNDVNSYGAALTPLVGQSTVARDNLLRDVASLQEYVTNASRAQRAADRLYTDAVNFKTVAEKAEETIIDSMTSLLENIASLEQAQADLVKSLTQSNAVQSIQIPSSANLELLVEKIDNATVSEEDVERLKLESQEALYVAEESVKGAQKALTMTRELNEEVQLMQDDIMAARDLRVQALGLKMASDSLNSSIHNILQQAQAHSDKADSDVTNVTQSAQEMQAEIRNVTLCLTQRQLDVTNAVTSANRAKERADSASTAQVSLIDVMSEINAEEAEAGISEVLANLTQADTIMREMESDLEQLQALAQMEDLINELTLQNQEITDLDQEITQLTSELDSVILLLQESNGGSSCNGT